MKAAKYRQVDDDFGTHRLAWLTFAASAKKGKSQRPVYSHFDKFYNYDREIKKLEGGDKRLKGLGEIIERQKREAENNGEL